MKNSTKGLLFAILTATMWGFLAIILKVALTNVPPVTVTWFRFSIAFVLLAVYYLISDVSSFSVFKKPSPLLILVATALGFNYLGFITGIHYTTPNIAQIFIQVGPFLLALSGFILFKEKLTVTKALAFAIIIVGFALFYNQQLKVSKENINFSKGVLWVVFGAVMWSVYAIGQKRLVRDINPMPLNLVIFGLPAIGYTPFVEYSVFSTMTVLDWILIFILGINTLIAYGSIALALKYLEANRVSVIITFNPVITFVVMGILGVLNVTWIVNEVYTPLTIIGATMVLAGTILANIKNRKVK